VTDDFPIEENIFHLRPGSDVVDNQIAAGTRRLLIYDDSDVGNSGAQVPGDQISGPVIFWTVG
jgi:hypothetical protein